QPVREPRDPVEMLTERGAVLAVEESDPIGVAFDRRKEQPVIDELFHVIPPRIATLLRSERAEWRSMTENPGLEPGYGPATPVGDNLLIDFVRQSAAAYAEFGLARGDRVERIEG